MNRIQALFILLFVLLITGCGSKLSSIFSESWSENFALAIHNSTASSPEINDGNINTMGLTKPPNREYTITFPEEKKIDRIVIYSGNVIAYKLFSWDNKANRWNPLGRIDTTSKIQRVYSDRFRLEIPRFDHRVNTRTDKLRLVVDRTESDGVYTTQTPGKNDKVINHRVDYIEVPGRGRIRIDLFDVYVQSQATIREIEVYSHVEKPKNHSRDGRP